MCSYYTLNPLQCANIDLLKKGKHTLCMQIDLLLQLEALCTNRLYQGINGTRDDAKVESLARHHSGNGAHRRDGVSQFLDLSSAQLSFVY